MLPRNSYRIEKTRKLESAVDKIRHLSLPQAAQDQIARILKELEDENDAPQHLAARDLKVEKVVEIFGLKEEFQLWGLRKGGSDVPDSLTFVLELIKDAPFDKYSEAYSRLTIDHLIMACFAKHKENLSKQSELLTKDPHNQIAPTTPSTTTESTSQPLPIKVFHEMPLAVQVERGSKKWVVSGILDWAIGYGDRAVLEDGTVSLAVKVERKELSSTAEGQLLAYLATLRQLRIQANKENVMTQGFFSDGENYRFICIRNDGTVMRSGPYDISLSNKRDLKSVFNFLLGMLTTAADSSPNKSPLKPGKERDEKNKNLDQDVFVRVIEDIDDDTDNDVEEDESCRLWITEQVV